MVVASTTQVASVSLLSSVSAPADAVISVCGWASSHGTLGLCAFAAVHTAAVVVCFPATILFELAAGFAFGVYQGAALAWSAKVTAALITFLASSGFARALLSNAGVEAAAEESMPAAPRKIALRRRKIALRRGRSMSSKKVGGAAGAPTRRQSDV